MGGIAHEPLAAQYAYDEEDVDHGRRHADGGRTPITGGPGRPGSATRARRRTATASAARTACPSPSASTAPATTSARPSWSPTAAATSSSRGHAAQLAVLGHPPRPVDQRHRARRHRRSTAQQRWCDPESSTDVLTRHDLRYRRRLHRDQVRLQRGTAFAGWPRRLPQRGHPRLPDARGHGVMIGSEVSGASAVWAERRRMSSPELTAGRASRPTPCAEASSRRLRATRDRRGAAGGQRFTHASTRRETAEFPPTVRNGRADVGGVGGPCPLVAALTAPRPRLSCEQPVLGLVERQPSRGRRDLEMENVDGAGPNLSQACCMFCAKTLPTATAPVRSRASGPACAATSGRPPSRRWPASAPRSISA